MTVHWPNNTIDTLLDCPPETLRWAAGGYRAGFHDGYETGYTAAENDMGTAWSAVATKVRRRSGQASFAELRARRDAPPAPCSLGCMACSVCIRWESWTGRGGRDYLGLDAERELAAREVTS